MKVGLSVTLAGDGWTTIEGVSGWESHKISVLAEVINGEPRVTALYLWPEPGGDAALTSLRLRALPLSAIAKAVTWQNNADLLNALKALQRSEPPKPGSRAAVSMEDFVTAWRAADAAPGPTRAMTCTTLLLATRSYDRYRRKAVDQGLIPDRKDDK